MLKISHPPGSIPFTSAVSPYADCTVWTHILSVNLAVAIFDAVQLRKTVYYESYVYWTVHHLDS